MKDLRIGLIGCGAIGRVVAKGVDREDFPARLAGLASRTRERASELSAELDSSPPVMDLPDLLAAADLAVEAVSPESARGVIDETLRADRDIMVLTVGALINHPELIELARGRRRTIHVPSGGARTYMFHCSPPPHSPSRGARRDASLTAPRHREPIGPAAG